MTKLNSVIDDMLMSRKGGGGGGGGTLKSFDMDARVTFLVSKFDNLLIYWVAQNEGYFLGVQKISIIFLVNWKFALFFGLLRKETTELLPINRFPLTFLLIF